LLVVEHEAATPVAVVHGNRQDEHHERDGEQRR
jgi:hypothetical protein